jgi:hypothetical protein
MLSHAAQVATKAIDPKGPGIVEEIFSWFEARGDKVARIFCGGAKHLKILQRHDCFEACLPDELPRDEDGSIPKGELFGARVFRSKQLEPNVIQAEGTAIEPGRGTPRNVCAFVERR